MKKFIIIVLCTLMMTGCTLNFNIGPIENPTEQPMATASNELIIDFDFNNPPIPTPEDCSTGYIIVNNNEPYFSITDRESLEAFEIYSDLDELGRCGTAYANICIELMPTEDRESIGSVKPTGWVQAKYDCVDGKYLYNRCHLIGFQLAGENANKLNLITGTRFLNNNVMLPFENMIADAVKTENIHVLYRVTPVFVDNNLLASGVLMEAYSVEDDGESICFCVYALNIQPNITINYTTGESFLN